MHLLHVQLLLAKVISTLVFYWWKRMSGQKLDCVDYLLRSRSISRSQAGPCTQLASVYTLNTFFSSFIFPSLKQKKKVWKPLIKQVINLISAKGEDRRWGEADKTLWHISKGINETFLQLNCSSYKILTKNENCHVSNIPLVKEFDQQVIRHIKY